MIHFRLLVLALAAALAVVPGNADDSSAMVPAAVVDPPAVRVPPNSVPGPSPIPGAALRLTPETICVIDADVPVRVLASPDRIVRIVRESGPLRVRGKFVDGGGRTETRNLNGKHLYFVEPVANGRVELLVVPTTDAKPDDSDVIRRTIDVQAGEGPIPPPPDPKPPGPDPRPDPIVPPPIPGDGLRVLIVYESADLAKYPPAQNAIFFSNKVRTHLDTRCARGPDGKTPEWRQYDQNADLKNDSQLWKDAMARPRKSLPWMIVSNGKTGYEGPLPADVENTIILVDKY